MDSVVVSVMRNEFTDTKGKVVKYCRFGLFTSLEENENQVGSTIEYFTTKYENYDLLVKAYKLQKPIHIEFQYVKTISGLYKLKPIKLGEVDLV